MNPATDGEHEQEAYLGTEPLDPALADRFGFLIEVPDFDLTSLQNPDEAEIEYEYDFRNDCEERALSDRTEISLDSNLSTSHRLAIVLVLVVVLRSRRLGIEAVCQDGRRMHRESDRREFRSYHPKNGRGRRTTTRTRRIRT